MIQFEQRTPLAERNPRRVDVPLFVGVVRRRSTTLVDPVHPGLRNADPVYRWLEAYGWTTPGVRRDAAPLEDLLDVPVPVESFDQFERLFIWEERLSVPGMRFPTQLGLAVWSFFREGGRRCYVVRVGDPWLPGEPGNVRSHLVPSTGGRPNGSSVDRSTWRGVWHLFGLPEASFVSIPDLPEACAQELSPPLPLPSPVRTVENFVECAPVAAELVPPQPPTLQAPRCDTSGYRIWADALRAAVEGIERADGTTTLRQVQVVAAVPMPTTELLTDSGGSLLSFLRETAGLDEPIPIGLSSPFLQLVYPWVRIEPSFSAPGGLATPEGVMLGVLAWNALTRGTFHSAAGVPVQSVLGLEPELSVAETQLRHHLPTGATLPTSVLDAGESLALTPIARGRNLPELSDNLVRRISLLGFTLRGYSLLSDVTTATSRAERAAQLRRLLSSVVRAAREAGEVSVFEASGPELWASLRDQITRILQGLWRAGGLKGNNAAEAFQVRCDESTMSRDESDQGRAVVEVELSPASAIGRILVSFTVQNGAITAGAA